MASPRAGSTSASKWGVGANGNANGVEPPAAAFPPGAANGAVGGFAAAPLPAAAPTATLVAGRPAGKVAAAMPGAQAANGGVGGGAILSTVRWIPDAEVSLCYNCQLLFDWVRRKHHCRYCGRIYCELCSSKRALIREERILLNPERKYFAANPSNPQRVCDECYNVLLPEQQFLQETNSNAVQVNTLNESGPQRFLNSPYSLTLREEIRKAAYSVKNFMYQGVIKDQSIPLPLLTKAKGLAFMTVIKVGFVFTGRIGTGLVISRLGDGRWSAPSAIGTAGLGWGAQIGGELTDFVIVLNTTRAVEAFCTQGQINMGAELGVSAGPIGRTAVGAIEASSEGIAPCYSYSHSKGLFAGISLEGSIILSRPDINRAFYGRDVVVSELLGGSIPPPVAASPLYDALNLAMNSPANFYNRRTPSAEAMRASYPSEFFAPSQQAQPPPNGAFTAVPAPASAERMRYSDSNIKI